MKDHAKGTESFQQQFHEAFLSGMRQSGRARGSTTRTPGKMPLRAQRDSDAIADLSEK